MVKGLHRKDENSVVLLAPLLATMTRSSSSYLLGKKWSFLGREGPKQGVLVEARDRTHGFLLAEQGENAVV